MNLHPYLTPELLTLIRTAEPKEIAEHFSHRDREWWFEIAAKRKKAFTMVGYHERPIIRFMMSSGYNGIKRRVELNQDNWREQFIQKLNEILHDCERIRKNREVEYAADCARKSATEKRKLDVLPLIHPAPAGADWSCENSQGLVREKLTVSTNKFTPEQIKQIVELIRSFNP